MSAWRANAGLTGCASQYFSYQLLWMVPYALLYPHLAHQLSQRFKHEHPRQTHLALLFIDALHAGAGISLLDFSVVPSLMIVLTLSFSALIIGGLRYMGLSGLVMFSGTLLCAAVSERDILCRACAAERGYAAINVQRRLAQPGRW
mgnify:CR=1 FL=1